MARITSFEIEDVRFPTSLTADGSDAMNKDGDYSAAYVVLRTDGVAFDGAPLAGFGLTFTTGRGNDIVAVAARQQAAMLVGLDVEEMVRDMGAVYRHLTADAQIRWLGPEKGVVHLSLSAVMNAAWDLAGRLAGKPVWRLLADMTPEQLVDVADLRYLSDALTREQAIDLLRAKESGKAARIAELEATGYPCYTTSAGWLGYSDDKLRRLCQEAVDEGYSHIKLKVGARLEDDIRRCQIAREVIGPDRALMIDANQVWDVDQAIEWTNALARFNLLWVEEPTSPDGRDRRALPQPGDVQAVHAGRRAGLLPTRHRAPGQRQRDRRRAAARREVRRPGVPARGRRWPVRDGPAHLDARLRRGLRLTQGARHRVHRPPPRALHRPLHRGQRRLPVAHQTRILHPDAPCVHRRVPLPRRYLLGSAHQGRTREPFFVDPHRAGRARLTVVRNQ